MKYYTHAACFVSNAKTLAFSHLVTEEQMKYWRGMIFLPLPPQLQDKYVVGCDYSRYFI